MNLVRNSGVGYELVDESKERKFLHTTESYIHDDASHNECSLELCGRGAGA